MNSTALPNPSDPEATFRSKVEKNVNLITTSLSGRDTADIMAELEFNAEETRVIKCPAGYQLQSCSYVSESGQCHVSLQRNQCAGCPYQGQCHPKIFLGLQSW